MTKTNLPVIILGSGGHAGVVAETLKKLNANILGIVSLDLEYEELFGIKILGGDEEVLKFSEEDVILVNGLGSIPGNNLRKKLSAKLRKQGYKFLSIVHPSAYLGLEVQLSEGSQVLTGSILHHSTSVGVDTIINTGSILDHNCSIGSHCHIAPGSVLSGNVTVGDNTHIGTGTKIIQNINIGENVVVAAGSVVYEDIDSGTNFIQKKKTL